MGRHDEDGHYETEFDLWFKRRVMNRDTSDPALLKRRCTMTRWRHCGDAVSYGGTVRCRRRSYCSFQQSEEPFKVEPRAPVETGDKSDESDDD